MQLPLLGDFTISLHLVATLHEGTEASEVCVSLPGLLSSLWNIAVADIQCVGWNEEAAAEPGRQLSALLQEGYFEVRTAAQSEPEAASLSSVVAVTDVAVLEGALEAAGFQLDVLSVQNVHRVQGLGGAAPARAPSVSASIVFHLVMFIVLLGLVCALLFAAKMLIGWRVALRKVYDTEMVAAEEGRRTPPARQVMMAARTNAFMQVPPPLEAPPDGGSAWSSPVAAPLRRGGIGPWMRGLGGAGGGSSTSLLSLPSASPPASSAAPIPSASSSPAASVPPSASLPLLPPPFFVPDEGFPPSW